MCSFAQPEVRAQTTDWAAFGEQSTEIGFIKHQLPRFINEHKRIRLAAQLCLEHADHVIHLGRITCRAFDQERTL